MTDETVTETSELAEFEEQSYEEMVRQVYEEEKAKINEETEDSTNVRTDSSEDTSSQETAPVDAGSEREPEEQASSRPKLVAPQSFNAEAKEWFNQLPEEFEEGKKEFHRIASEFDKWRIKSVNELKEAQRQVSIEREPVRGVLDVVNRFLPRWGAVGKTPEAAVSELCAFNELVITDPDAALETIAKKTGRQIEIKNRANSSQNNQSQPNYSLQDVQEHARQGVRTELQTLSQQNLVNQLTEGCGQAIEEIQSEVNDQGRYMFPDFHDVAFQRQLEPLAQGIARANPEIGWREILLRAYRGAGGRVIPRTTPQTAKPNGQNNVNIARRARSSIAGNQAGNYQELPFIPNEKVEDTVRRAFERHSGR